MRRRHILSFHIRNPSHHHEPHHIASRGSSSLSSSIEWKTTAATITTTIVAPVVAAPHTIVTHHVSDGDCAAAVATTTTTIAAATALVINHRCSSAAAVTAGLGMFLKARTTNTTSLVSSSALVGPFSTTRRLLQKVTTKTRTTHGNTSSNSFVPNSNNREDNPFFAASSSSAFANGGSESRGSANTKNNNTTTATAAPDNTDTTTVEVTSEAIHDAIFSTLMELSNEVSASFQTSPSSGLMMIHPQRLSVIAGRLPEEMLEAMDCGLKQFLEAWPERYTLKKNAAEGGAIFVYLSDSADFSFDDGGQLGGVNAANKKSYRERMREKNMKKFPVSFSQLGVPEKPNKKAPPANIPMAAKPSIAPNLSNKTTAPRKSSASFSGPATLANNSKSSTATASPSSSSLPIVPPPPPPAPVAQMLSSTGKPMTAQPSSSSHASVAQSNQVYAFTAVAGSFPKSDPNAAFLATLENRRAGYAEPTTNAASALLADFTLLHSWAAGDGGGGEQGSSDSNNNSESFSSSSSILLAQALQQHQHQATHTSPFPTRYTTEMVGSIAGLIAKGALPGCDHLRDLLPYNTEIPQQQQMRREDSNNNINSDPAKKKAFAPRDYEAFFVEFIKMLRDNNDVLENEDAKKRGERSSGGAKNEKNNNNNYLRAVLESDLLDFSSQITMTMGAGGNAPSPSDIATEIAGGGGSSKSSSASSSSMTNPLLNHKRLLPVELSIPSFRTAYPPAELLLESALRIDPASPTAPQLQRTFGTAEGNTNTITFPRFELFKRVFLEDIVAVEKAAIQAEAFERVKEEEDEKAAANRRGDNNSVSSGGEFEESAEATVNLETEVAALANAFNLFKKLHRVTHSDRPLTVREICHLCRPFLGRQPGEEQIMQKRRQLVAAKKKRIDELNGKLRMLPSSGMLPQMTTLNGDNDDDKYNDDDDDDDDKVQATSPEMTKIAIQQELAQLSKEIAEIKRQHNVEASAHEFFFSTALSGNRWGQNSPQPRKTSPSSPYVPAVAPIFFGRKISRALAHLEEEMFVIVAVQHDWAERVAAGERTLLRMEMKEEEEEEEEIEKRNSRSGQQRPHQQKHNRSYEDLINDWEAEMPEESVDVAEGAAATGATAAKASTVTTPHSILGDDGDAKKNNNGSSNDSNRGNSNRQALREKLTGVKIIRNAGLLQLLSRSNTDDHFGSGENEGEEGQSERFHVYVAIHPSFHNAIDRYLKNVEAQLQLQRRLSTLSSDNPSTNAPSSSSSASVSGSGGGVISQRETKLSPQTESELSTRRGLLHPSSNTTSTSSSSFLLPNVEEYDVFRIARFMAGDEFTPLAELARRASAVTAADLMHVLLAAPDLFSFEYGRVAAWDSARVVNGSNSSDRNRGNGFAAAKNIQERLEEALERFISNDGDNGSGNQEKSNDRLVASSPQSGGGLSCSSSLSSSSPFEIVVGVRYKIHPFFIPTGLLLATRHISVRNLTTILGVANQNRARCNTHKRAAMRSLLWLMQRVFAIRSLGTVSTMVDPRVYAHFVYDTLPDQPMAASDLFIQLFMEPVLVEEYLIRQRQEQLWTARQQRESLQQQQQQHHDVYDGYQQKKRHAKFASANPSIADSGPGYGLSPSRGQYVKGTALGAWMQTLKNAPSTIDCVNAIRRRSFLHQRKQAFQAFRYGFGALASGNGSNDNGNNNNQQQHQAIGNDEYNYGNFNNNYNSSFSHHSNRNNNTNNSSNSNVVPRDYFDDSLAVDFCLSRIPPHSFSVEATRRALRAVVLSDDPSYAAAAGVDVTDAHSTALMATTFHTASTMMRLAHLPISALTAMKMMQINGMHSRILKAFPNLFNVWERGDTWVILRADLPLPEDAQKQQKELTDEELLMYVQINVEASIASIHSVAHIDYYLDYFPEIPIEQRKQCAFLSTLGRRMPKFVIAALKKYGGCEKFVEGHPQHFRVINRAVPNPRPRQAIPSTEGGGFTHDLKYHEMVHLSLVWPIKRK